LNPWGSRNRNLGAGRVPFPLKGALSETEGFLTPEVEAFLMQHPQVMNEAVAVLLDDHFEEAPSPVAVAG